MHTFILVNSFVLQFETTCNSSEFMDLENLIGSLHRYAPNYGHLFVRNMGLTTGQQKLLKLYENIEIISSKHRQKGNISLINVKNEFFVNHKKLSNRPNNGKYNYIDSIRKQFRLAIVIPFIQSQFNTLIDQLNIENIYSPCRSPFKSIDLIFYHNEQPLSILDYLIRQLNYEHRCFKNIRIFAANLSEEENAYPIGSTIMWKKLFIDEHLSNISLRYHGYTHFFLMEPDTRPIRSYWLDAIVEQIINSHTRESYISTRWWMTGSVYRGFESIGQNAFHINGNALYHLSLSFVQFIELFLKDCRTESQRVLGYDLGLFLYLFKNIDEGKKFWHKFQFSDFIQNCWHTSCNETNTEFLYENPNTYLIHGNRILQTSLTISTKREWIKFYGIIIFIMPILFLLITIKRMKYFRLKLLYTRNFLLRIFFK
ncbi:unnamed protein product [Rotaria magnacalcarata]|uniref:Uncharacterized protein n=1 Tax=Rotaria magnacalcarata TaxID=392030 RepID=A0A815K0C4_9BILA|nr:unnamed protein product [Rotaria magnacalcarata]CAF1384737.1 unnamed protein product [Rotaria magnacalcarata]CAF2153809.1 unnamed protein product [Rotaria magnacalcarata]CAF3885091.1 unnamed protein product [Rotaria magnacalcarata]CAF3909691.1 unnamed protein product [Rotaria magnacalcarata]